MKYRDSAYQILPRILPHKAWKKLCYYEKYKKLRKRGLGTMLNKNRSFKNLYKGKRCFILGSGPSLSGEDLSVLKDEITFTTNEMYYQEQFDQIGTTYHLFADPHYMGEIDEKIKQLLEHARPKAIFVESAGYEALLKKSCQENYPVYIYANGMEVEDLDFIPIDLCGMLPYFCTVVQSAIAIAVYMGFESIYLLGCDCTGIINYIQRVLKQKMNQYAYQLPEEEERKQQSISITGEHMFFEWYHIFKSYRLLLDYLTQRNIRMINLSQNSILDSIEKGKLKDVILSK